jgi:hypothetical protein
MSKLTPDENELAVRVFQIIDGARRYIEALTGTDLQAMVQLPARDKVLEMLETEALGLYNEIIILETDLKEARRASDAARLMTKSLLHFAGRKISERDEASRKIEERHEQTDA